MAIKRTEYKHFLL